MRRSCCGLLSSFGAQVKEKLKELESSSLNFTWERHELPIAVGLVCVGWRQRYLHMSTAAYTVQHLRKSTISGNSVSTGTVGSVKNHYQGWALELRFDQHSGGSCEIQIMGMDALTSVCVLFHVCTCGVLLGEKSVPTVQLPDFHTSLCSSRWPGLYRHHEYTRVY